MTVEVEWARMTAPALRKLAEREGALAVLPIGALEQHGSHLPVITDTASAYAVAVRAARLVAGEVPVAVLPGLWLGMSEHHLPYGATISVDYATLVAMLRSIVRSLAAIGFKRLLILNGHGGNIPPLAVATREIAVEFDFPVVAAVPWDMAPEEMSQIFESGQKGVMHACEGETSVMMAITPDTVLTGNFELAYRNNQKWPRMPSGVTRFHSFAEPEQSFGVLGDPRSATAEKGERFLALQAREVARLMQPGPLWTAPDDVWRRNRALEG